MYPFINHELEYFCVNKRCEDLDKIVILHTNELTENRTKSTKTPKCIKCTKQLKGTSKTKDLVLAFDSLLKIDFFNKWKEEHKNRCNGPLEQNGISDKGIPIWYCIVCKENVYGYNHRRIYK
jgi:hypothetical protein